jgi:ABC-type branched-subunit amino acid transport system substrate-binding protein
VSSLPSRGLFRIDTTAVRTGIDAALAEHQATSDKRVEHIALEGGSDETGEWTASIEAGNATAAAKDPSVIAYIGPHNSGAVAVALPITSRAGLLHSSPSATWPGLTRPGWDPGEPTKYYAEGLRNFVRLSPPDSYQALAAADWVTDDGRTKVLVLHDGSTYSEGLAREFHASLPDIATAPVHVQSDVQQALLPSLEGHDAAYIAPSSAQSAGRLAVALARSALPVYSTDVALDPQFLEYAGAAARNWHIVSNSATAENHWPASIFTDTPAGVARIRPALNAYVLTRLVTEAVDAGDSSREDVLSHVRGRRLEDGVPLFDAAGDPTGWTMNGYNPAGNFFEVVRGFKR